MYPNVVGLFEACGRPKTGAQFLDRVIDGPLWVLAEQLHGRLVVTCNLQVRISQTNEQVQVRVSH